VLSRDKRKIIIL